MNSDTQEIWAIRKLVIEGFKRIVAVEITPDGKVVQLRGKNDQGKSSIVDAIWAALGGLDAAPERPVRDGAERARIELSLGPDDDPTKGVIVTRMFDPRGNRYSSLRVAAANGSIFPSPQHMLEDFYAALTLDPLNFTRLRPAERVAVLAQAAGIDLAVIAALEAKNKIDFDLRASVNRDAKTMLAKASGIQFPEGLPSSLVDESALAAELATAGERNAERERRIAGRQRAVSELNMARAKAQSSREEADELRARADALELVADELDARSREIEQQIEDVAALPDVVDTGSILAKISAARDTNRFIQERHRSQELAADAEALHQRSTALTEAIRQRQEEIRATVASGTMPVEGLELGGADVLLRGIPFDQLSQAVKIKTSAAIAMAAKPRIRILCVRDGTLLDDDNFKLLVEMAKEAGYQLWIESVDNNAQVGFIIEDGHVRAAAPAKAADEKQQALSLGLV